MTRGMFDVVTGTDNGQTSVSTARWTLAVGCIASLLIASKVTRNRVAEAKEPMLGLFF